MVDNFSLGTNAMGAAANNRVESGAGSNIWLRAFAGVNSCKDFVDWVERIARMVLIITKRS